MKSAALLLASATGAQVSPSWESYKAAFNKNYASPDEEAHARNCWAENVAYMQDVETNGGVKQGENSFSDQCWEDFAASRLTLDQGLNGDACDQSVDPYTKPYDESQELDWRTEGYVNPVKDQESCGSCWAFSAMATAEGAYFKATGKLLSFSEQQLVSCDTTDGNNGCQGGMPGAAFKYLVKAGAALESDYPYTGSDDSCHLPQTSAAFASWQYVDTSGGEQKLLAALQNEGPISVTVMARGVWQSYVGGIVTVKDCPSMPLINHAVVAVGYGKENGSPYWVIRNSWGPSWGESGYIRLSYGEGTCSITACNAAFISGSQSVVV